MASAVVAMASVRQRSSVPKLSNALRPKHYLPKEVGAVIVTLSAPIKLRASMGCAGEEEQETPCVATVPAVESYRGT